MSKAVTTVVQNVSSKVAEEIGGLIYEQFGAVLAGESNKRDAQAAFQASVTAESSGRGEVMARLAEQSASHKWSQREITAAAEWIKATKKSNDPMTEKSLGTFMTDVRCFMDPSVAAHVGTLFRLASEAFDLEKLDKDGPQVCRSYFKREYHMAKQLAGVRYAKGKGDGKIITTYDAAAVFAQEQLDAAKADPNKAIKTIEAAVTELQRILQQFPVDALGDAIGYLNGIDVDVLKAANDAVKTERSEAQARIKLPATTAARPIVTAANITPEMLDGLMMQ